MLPAANRMRSGTDFSTAVRRGRRIGRRTVVLHYVQVADQAAAPRVGFVVSKAVGGAVVRNRVKRRLRHAVVPYLSLLVPGDLLVVRANPAAAGVADGLARDLDSAFGSLPAGAR